MCRSETQLIMEGIPVGGSRRSFLDGTLYRGLRYRPGPGALPRDRNVTSRQAFGIARSSNYEQETVIPVNRVPVVPRVEYTNRIDTQTRAARRDRVWSAFLDPLRRRRNSPTAV